ncbi:AraC family transcriptional regulator [Flavobacteriaceae bacterium KMM 6898]|nr:AraC family transcriptional regulator [Flavobacteriaceae bacterium KMM 6898]
MEYSAIIKKINENEYSTKKLDYAKGYLSKAIANNDSINVLVGYEIIAAVSEGSEAIIYLDSIINMTLNKPDNFYPGNAYLNKARNFYTRRKFKPALDNYLEAYNFAKKYPNDQILFESRYGLGILKSRIGAYEETISIQKENLIFFDEKTDLNNSDKYLNTLFSIANAYSKLNVLDSAKFYNTKGLSLSIEMNDELMRKMFVLNEGIIKLQQGQFKDALLDISIGTEGVSKFRDIPNTIVGNYYLGKIYMKLNKDELGVEYLKKVDSLFNITHDIHPEVRETYNLLTKYYKGINDKEKQLKYLNRLISVDSILNDYKIYLVDGINRNYDTPELLERKEVLIENLNRDKNYLYLLLVFVSIVLGIIILKYIKIQKKYKERFETLMANNGLNIINQVSPSSDKIDVPLEIMDAVLVKLSEFEEKAGFLDSSITLSSLAKSFKTNSNYLSKIINYQKGKNFTTYLNELRIEYSIKKLKSNATFRKFTIIAIANDVGFKSSETFSRIFKSKTGIYPSYFIKKLEKSN